jgi:hypothetical protein
MLCCLLPCLINKICDKSINDNRGSISYSCIELWLICCFVLCLFNIIREMSIQDNITLSIQYNTWQVYTWQLRQYLLRLYWTMSHMLCCLVLCLFNTTRDKSIHDNRGSNSFICIEICLICCLVLCLFNTIRDKSVQDNWGCISCSCIKICLICCVVYYFVYSILYVKTSIHDNRGSISYLYWTMSHMLCCLVLCLFNTYVTSL